MQPCAAARQGAIQADVKAKQAVGGVQLVRLSFPPTLGAGGSGDVDMAAGVIDRALVALYSS